MTVTRPILIVEDDDALRQVLVDQLEADGAFRAIETATLGEAARHLAVPDQRVDAVILDLTLPDGDGGEFCAQMRREGHAMPVIILTGAADEAETVRGLNAGANDYVTKPFRTKELMARLHAQLRMFNASEAAVFTIGPYTFRPAAKLLFDQERKQRIPLTAKEVAILKYLYKHPNQVVDRQTLLSEIWGYNSGVETHTLETHIYRLRQKIEIDPANSSRLRTVPGGYLLDPSR